jgi:hypothetical protein
MRTNVRDPFELRDAGVSVVYNLITEPFSPFLRVALEPVG